MLVYCKCSFQVNLSSAPATEVHWASTAKKLRVSKGIATRFRNSTSWCFYKQNLCLFHCDPDSVSSRVAKSMSLNIICSNCGNAILLQKHLILPLEKHHALLLKRVRCWIRSTMRFWCGATPCFCLLWSTMHFRTKQAKLSVCLAKVNFIVIQICNNSCKSSVNFANVNMKRPRA